MTWNNKWHNRTARLFCIAVTCLAAAQAQPSGWTRPVALSTGGQGWEAAAAMDANGNVVALWDERTSQDQLWSRAKPAAGNWGRASQVSPALQTTLVFPVIRISAAGFATAVWTDSDGVWTADRPPTGNWNPPQPLVSGASGPIFVMNAHGDAAVVWTAGGPPGTQSAVLATLRPAGAGWTIPLTLASGVYVFANHAGISAEGTVIATWETYHAFCNSEGCEFSHFALHASRHDVGGGWVRSGVLLGPDNDSHDARAALDAQGQAMLVALSGSGTYVSATQGSSGGDWSGFNTVVDVQGISIVSDVASDSAGNVTMIYETIGFGSQAFAVDGSISSNAWSPPVLLSGSDMTVSQIYFAVAANGVGVAVWLSSSETPEIHAVIRDSASGTWSTPVTVSAGGSSEISPEAAAVSASGSAIIVYSGYNKSDIHTEYAANYTP